MIVTVRLFARARDLAGSDTLAVVLPEAATVGQLRRQLVQECPALAGLLERSVLAVDEDLATDATVLTEVSEVALLPPVSGGCDSPLAA